MEGRKPDIWMEDLNDNIWARDPKRPCHDALHRGLLRDPMARLNPEAKEQDVTTRTRRLDAILISPTAWGTLQPTATAHIAMHTSDHKLVLVCTGHTAAEKAAFVRAPYPTKRWTKKKEAEVTADIARSTPRIKERDPVKRATITLKVIARKVKEARIMQGPKGKGKGTFD